MIRDIINEGKAESGQGSKAGREKYTSKKGIEADSVKARKSRSRIYPTIMSALKSSAGPGTIFSTKGADRLYVITKQKWGTDKDQVVGNRVAKGFTPGSATPSAKYSSIKAHARRISAKHKGGQKEKSYKESSEESLKEKCEVILELVNALREADRKTINALDTSDTGNVDKNTSNEKGGLTQDQKDARAVARTKVSALKGQVAHQNRKLRQGKIDKHRAEVKSDKKKAAFKRKLSSVGKFASRMTGGVQSSGNTKPVSDT